MKKVMFLLISILCFALAAMCQTSKKQKDAVDSLIAHRPKQDSVPNPILTISMPASQWDGIADIIDKTNVGAQQYKDAMKVVAELRRQYFEATKPKK